MVPREAVGVTVGGGLETVGQDARSHGDESVVFCRKELRAEGQKSQ